MATWKYSIGGQDRVFDAKKILDGINLHHINEVESEMARLLLEAVPKVMVQLEAVARKRVAWKVLNPTSNPPWYKEETT